MASRRIVTDEKTGLLAQSDASDPLPAGGPPGPSIIAPAVPSAVIAKLLGFTFAMITLPIGSYFLAVNTVLKGHTTWAGALAAIMANVVLIGYVIVAMKEDQSDRLEAEAEEKKKSR